MDGKGDVQDTAPHDKDPLAAVRHSLIEIGRMDDVNTSAELDFGMLGV